MKPRITITQEFPGMEKFKKQFKIELKKNLSIKSYFMISMVADKVDKTFLIKNKHLLGVSNYAVGFDNIDLTAATELGIPVTNTPAVISNSTAEHTFALMLSIMKRIPEADIFIRQNKFKQWDPNLFIGQDLKGKTLGIVGFGKVGKRLGEIASGFDVKVIFLNSSIKKKTGFYQCGSLNELLEKSDIVSLHVPLTEKTKHLIGLDQIKRMKRSAYLINASRGPVVNEAELALALEKELIAGAAIDVFEFEPQVNDKLKNLKNVVMTPHTGTAVKNTRLSMTDLVFENLLALTKFKKAPYTINPEVYQTQVYKDKIEQLKRAL